MNYTIRNTTTGEAIEHHDNPTAAARACAILNAHNRKNGHTSRYAYTPEDKPFPFDLPDWAKPYASEDKS